MKRLLGTLALVVALVLPARAVTLNTLGQVAQGVGGGIAAYDDHAVAQPAGGTAWITDDEIVYQVCANGCQIQKFNVRTGQYSTASPSGANDLYAGGGVWAAWLGGAGVFTSTGITLPESGLGPVGPDGAIAVKVLRNSFGPWDVLERDGSRWRLTDCDAHDIQLLGAHRAVFMCGNTVQANGLPAPSMVLPGTLWWTRTTFVNGQPWVMYQSERAGARLLVHPYDSLQGYVVTQGGNSYAPDFMQFGSKLRVAYATVASEAPGQVVVTDIDLSAPRVNLSTLLPTTPPAITPPPVVVTPPQSSIPNQKSIVEEVRKKYPTPLGDQHGWFLIEVAQRTGGKLFRKDGGDHTTLPDGTNVSLDIVIIETPQGPWWVDVLGDAENTAKPDWAIHPNAEQPEKFLDVRKFTVPGTPVVVTPPTPPVVVTPPPPNEDPRIAQLQKQLNDARVEITDLNALHTRDWEEIARLNDQISSLTQELEKLKAQPQPSCEALVPAWVKSIVKVGCRIK